MPLFFGRSRRSADADAEMLRDTREALSDLRGLLDTLKIEAAAEQYRNDPGSKEYYL